MIDENAFSTSYGIHKRWKTFILFFITMEFHDELIVTKLEIFNFEIPEEDIRKYSNGHRKTNNNYNRII